VSWDGPRPEKSSLNVDVELVKLPVSVLDKDGRVVEVLQRMISISLRIVYSRKSLLILTIKRIAHDLRSQDNIGYTPTNTLCREG
jgi:hypothetical protein